MLNQTVLVGRIVNDIEVITTKSGKKVTNITLAVTRSFKNTNGEYDTDFIKCSIWENMATNTAEYCNKGNIIGIKGRLQANNDQLELIAERVTFLGSNKEK